MRKCYDETPTIAAPLTVPYAISNDTSVDTDKSKMCPFDVTQGGNELLTWPATAIGETAVSDETCPRGTSYAGYSLAVRHCSLSTSSQVQWDSARMLSCSETETSGKEQVAGTCQPDWELFGSFCYHLETEQKGSFSDATDFCQRSGGNLTSIHSPQEQAYHVELKRKTGKDIWIGLHDITDEGHFEWIDGTPLNYKSWEPNQPDDWSVVGGEDCVYLSHLDMWNDNLCSPINGFICKQPQNVSAGYCVPDETYTTGGVLTWPKTKAEQTAFSEETCGVNTDNSGLPLGTRYCRPTSEWGNVQMLRCYDETKSKTSALKAGKTSFMSPGTKIAISVALIAVALTLLVFVLTRRLRESNSYHATGNVCGGIFILYLTFAAGIDATDNSTGCILVAAMLHYFSLVSLLWLAVEIRNSYGICSSSDEAQQQLQFGSLVKAYAAAWGIPAVVLAVTMIISFADYRNTYYCAVSAGPALFYGNVIPILLIVIHNVITFICAFLALRHRPFTHDVSVESLKNRDSWQRAHASLLVSVVFTISVCFAYLHLINPSTIALRVLFSISVAATGLIILGMFCLYLDDVRRAVLPKTWQREDQEMMVPFSFQNTCDEGEEGHTNAVEIPDT